MHRASLLARNARRLPAAVLRALLAAARRWPVSNDKIGLEYKLKRFLEGCLMPAARAHVYWSGTFDDREKRSLIQTGAAAGARFRPAKIWPPRATICRPFLVRSEILSSGQHSDQSRSHQHGARDGSAAAVSRSSDRRIRDLASRRSENPGHPAEVILRNLMRGKLASGDSQRKKSASIFPRMTGSADRCGRARGSRGIRSAEHGEFFQSPANRSSFERISTGAPTWAIICGA